MQRTIYFIYILLLYSTGTAIAQHLYQKPKPLKAKTELTEIIGPIHTDKTKHRIDILWVYGYDEHHIAGAHDYVKIKDLMIDLLSGVNNVKINEAFHFPTDKQFESVDLIIMYLHLPQLSENQFAALKNFVINGGAIISLHETAIMRPAVKGKMLAECLGSAWHEGTSKWGAIFDKININNRHQIFSGFPTKLTIVDEFYWGLYQEENVEVLGTVRTGPDEDSDGPIDQELLSEEESPVFWTYKLGEGKVFGTTTGHHTFTYYDPEFRIILFRAIAWAVNERADPFMPLVYEGITNAEGFVGINDDMRYWKGKRRK